MTDCTAQAPELFTDTRSWFTDDWAVVRSPGESGLARVFCLRLFYDRRRLEREQDDVWGF